MSNPNYDLEQRAVYRALNRMTQDFALIQNGYQFWEGNYSNIELDLNDFSDALKNHLGLSTDQKRVLIVSLHSSLSKMVGDLDPVPGAVLANAKVATGAVQATSESKESFAPALSAHHVITSKFLQTMAKTVGKDNSSAKTDLSEIIEETIKDIKEDKLHSPIMNWANDGFAKLTLPKGISEKDCVDLAHFLYLAASDAIGPVKSDEIMDSVIKALKDTQEADQFNPQRFI